MGVAVLASGNMETFWKQGGNSFVLRLFLRWFRNMGGVMTLRNICTICPAPRGSAASAVLFGHDASGLSAGGVR